MSNYYSDRLIFPLVISFFGFKWFNFPFFFKMRIIAYSKYFNIGKKPINENNIHIHGAYKLEGKINIGKNILLVKGILLDFFRGIV